MKAPWVWVIWMAAVLVMLSITRNPLYLTIILLCVVFVGIALWRAGSEPMHLFSPLKLAVWIILLATVFNALTSHHGETVLFAIPGKIPLLSGRVTLEGVVYGATNGLILTGMLASFTVLNLALPVRDLIGLIPRAFFPVAVVTSIAVTYLPTTLRQFGQIREAQAVRGHQMRSLRDWLPLMMPLLVGGLEHAMQLAEAMTARGFASTRVDTEGKQLQVRILMLSGVVLLASGWLAQIGWKDGYGWVMMPAGALFILFGIWWQGRYSVRTTYRRVRSTWKDGLVLLAVLVVLAMAWVPSPVVSRASLYYDPYPKLSLPPFDPYLGIAILGLMLPGILYIICLNKDL